MITAAMTNNLPLRSMENQAMTALKNALLTCEA